MTVDEHHAGQAVSAERLVFFTDAIVAIAITLLILPLLESIPEAGARGLTAGAWLGEHASQLLAFVVSFAVVSYQWVSHHHLFAPLESVSRDLMWLDIAWVFTIVFLQLPSAMIYTLATDGWSLVLYIGTLSIAQGLLAVLSWRVTAHPELLEPGATIRVNTRTHVAVTGLFFAALLVAALVPAVGFNSMFLLWLVPVVRRIPWIARGRVTTRSAAA